MKISWNVKQIWNDHETNTNWIWTDWWQSLDDYGVQYSSRGNGSQSRRNPIPAVELVGQRHILLAVLALATVITTTTGASAQSANDFDKPQYSRRNIKKWRCPTSPERREISTEWLASKHKITNNRNNNAPNQIQRQAFSGHIADGELLGAKYDCVGRRRNRQHEC